MLIRRRTEVLTPRQKRALRRASVRKRAMQIGQNSPEKTQILNEIVQKMHEIAEDDGYVSSENRNKSKKKKRSSKTTKPPQSPNVENETKEEVSEAHNPQSANVLEVTDSSLLETPEKPTETVIVSVSQQKGFSNPTGTSAQSEPERNSPPTPKLNLLEKLNEDISDERDKFDKMVQSSNYSHSSSSSNSSTSVRKEEDQNGNTNCEKLSVEDSENEFLIGGDEMLGQIVTENGALDDSDNEPSSAGKLKRLRKNPANKSEQKVEVTASTFIDDEATEDRKSDHNLLDDSLNKNMHGSKATSTDDTLNDTASKVKGDEPLEDISKKPASQQSKITSYAVHQEKNQQSDSNNAQKENSKGTEDNKSLKQRKDQRQLSKTKPPSKRKSKSPVRKNDKSRVKFSKTDSIAIIPKETQDDLNTVHSDETSHHQNIEEQNKEVPPPPLSDIDSD